MAANTNSHEARTFFRAASGLRKAQRDGAKLEEYFMLDEIKTIGLHTKSRAIRDRCARIFADVDVDWYQQMDRESDARADLCERESIAEGIKALGLKTKLSIANAPRCITDLFGPVGWSLRETTAGPWECELLGCVAEASDPLDAIKSAILYAHDLRATGEPRLAIDSNGV